MTTREVLLKAADIIEEKGWYQGNMIGPKGELCMLGALNVASDYSLEYFNVRTVVRDHLHISVKDKSFSLSNWNDAPERTKEEVIAALRGAAEEQA